MTNTSAPKPVSTSPRLAIGLDIGGTKIAGAVVTDRGNLLHHLAMPTPDTADQEQIMTALLHMVGELRESQPTVEAIGVGAAGLIEWPQGYIRWAPNNSYRQVPLLDLLEVATGLPVVVDNDANAAAWAEARLGHGVIYRNLLFITVGTGVGGGLLLDGQVYRGRTGLATEFGHIIVNPHGELCGCGNRGCVEAMASGTALERLGRHAIVHHPGSHLAQLADNNPNNVTGRLILHAARSGDPIALSLFGEIGYWLGVGLASLTSIFELDAIIIGGGLVEAANLLLDPTLASIREFAFAQEHRPVPPVVAGTFGADAGVIGAAHLALCAVENAECSRCLADA